MVTASFSCPTKLPRIPYVVSHHVQFSLIVSKTSSPVGLLEWGFPTRSTRCIWLICHLICQPPHHPCKLHSPLHKWECPHPSQEQGPTGVCSEPLLAQALHLVWAAWAQLLPWS